MRLDNFAKKMMNALQTMRTLVRLMRVEQLSHHRKLFEIQAKQLIKYI